MKKHIMIIGASGSGKSTVANWLNDSQRPLKKSQDAIYGKYTLDIPSGYLENPSMYRYILSLSQTAGLVVLLAEGEGPSVFPPNFARTFSCSVIGLVMTHRGANHQEAVKVLREAGVLPPYDHFDPTSDSLAALKAGWLKNVKGEMTDEICDGN